MTERVFIDTNVFVHAEDEDEPAKRAVAQRLIQELAAEERAVVSTQVLSEYVAAARRKLGLSLAACREAVLLMCQLHVVGIRPEHVLGAIDLASVHSLSPWDALIVRAASASGCARLLSEDLSHGQVIDGVRVENPFNGREFPQP
ncbi:MAG TPA: PIN domain-containing protein [Actinomycetes bacterium]